MTSSRPIATGDARQKWAEIGALLSLLAMLALASLNRCYHGLHARRAASHRLGRSRSRTRAARTLKAAKPMETLKVCVRWILVVPAAVGGAWLTWFLLGVINRFTMLTAGIDPQGFIAKAQVEAIVSSGLGAAFIYVGASVAPTYRKKVSYVLALLGVLVICASMYFAVQYPSRYGWSIWGLLWAALGIAVIVYAVWKDEVLLLWGKNGSKKEK